MEAMKPYKKDFSYSYALGAFPTVELLRARPDAVHGVYIHSTFEDTSGIRELCAELGVQVYEGDRAIARVSPKENVYVVGVFGKYEDALCGERPHVVLVNPGDMGNLGNIMRTAAAFGFEDIALIEPCADRFAPRTVRASMGAVFRVRTHRYASFDEYRSEFPDHTVYTFMLTGARPLGRSVEGLGCRYSLVFGNEATGLPDEYAGYGTSILIEQSPAVDSLNLTIAAGIGMYIFGQSGMEAENEDSHRI